MATLAKRKYNASLHAALNKIGLLEAQHKLLPSPQLFSDLSTARLHLRQLLLSKTEHALRKSKAKFYSMGDRAGALLARRVKKMEVQSKIHYIQRSDGSLIYNPIHIAEEFASYYSSLYNLKSDPNIPEPSQSSIASFLDQANLPSVTSDQLSFLNAPNVPSEIAQIIKEAKKRSAPGPDGFSLPYYAQFLPTLSPYLLRFFNHWLSTGDIKSEGLEASIATLPKPGKPSTSPGNFRPIALLNCDVKIYAKIWANKLMSILPSLVHPDQVGFVPGRQTRDGTRRLIDLLDVIKPADKGGVIVVMAWSYYISEIQSQLRNTETYTPISSNPTFDIARKIKYLIEQYSGLGVSDSKLREFLINQHPVILVFYTLPKVHKDLWKPPGRPIVASTNSILSPLAITLEKILTPWVSYISYLKDMPDFLKSIMNIEALPFGSKLGTLDVNSLYTSIDDQVGIEAENRFLANHTIYSRNQICFCEDLLKLIFTEILFLFEDQFYVQRRGTAFGSNTSYVYNHPLFATNVIHWKRFIEDIFFIWIGGDETLTQFYTDLNRATTDLSFTIHCDIQSIHFLDTTISITMDRKLETDLYTKPTDKNSLLHYTSCQPQHIKSALIFPEVTASPTPDPANVILSRVFIHGNLHISFISSNALAAWDTWVKLASTSVIGYRSIRPQSDVDGRCYKSPHTSFRVVILFVRYLYKQPTRFFKVVTFCFDDCFADSQHSLDELQEVVTGNGFHFTGVPCQV
ncbi:unnamed protein product [Ranitomeya imitator]|uniref:Reverse transcriptase domain-containing protein n=1 Tax=Ranitomeya imitator TaxID=111125 RepID=A0ABN9LSU7_9NEOB|nr:unnamed protein product [Ranitomeya imitator]